MPSREFVICLFVSYVMHIVRQHLKETLLWSIATWLTFEKQNVKTGGFPLSRNFSVRTHVNYARVHKIETLYGRSRIYVKVEPRSTSTFTRGLSYIASISFTRVIYVRAHGEITWQWKSTLRKDSRPKRVCTAEQGKVFTVLGLNRGIQFHYLVYWTEQFA